MTKTTLATIWLDGCSGCHMSFLDLDERLIELGDRVDLVYSPLVDRKEFPDSVDVCLVEGAVSSEEDLRKLRMVRERCKILLAFGDCAVTTNVPGMRNAIGVQAVLERAYIDNAQLNKGIPDDRRASAAPGGTASAPRGAGRQLPARMPAVRGPHLAGAHGAP